MMNAEEMTLLKSLRKDSETLAKARAVLEDHSEAVDNARAFYKTGKYNSFIDPLIELADALEAE